MRSSCRRWVTLVAALSVLGTPVLSYPQTPPTPASTPEVALPGPTVDCAYFKPVLLPVNTQVVFSGQAPQLVACPIFGLHRLDAEDYYALKQQAVRDAKPLSFWQTAGGITVIAVASAVVGGVAVGLIVHYVPKN